MNEPKKRGRPPKAKPCHDCGQEVGHYDDCPVGLGVVDANAAGMKAFVGLSDVPPAIAAAQAYAMRVWNGQSPQVKPAERIRRVAAALEGQGMSMEGVTLP